MSTNTLSPQAQRLQSAVDAFQAPFLELGRSFMGWKREEPVSPGVTSRIKDAAGVLYDALDIQFEDPIQAKKLAQYIRRLQNFRKFVKAYRDVSDTTEMTTLYKSQTSNSKTPWNKFLEYRDEALGLVKTFDSLNTGQINVGGIHVVLLRTGKEDFEPETLERLRSVLQKAERSLAQRGLGSLTENLTIVAHPTPVIPGTAGVNAYYYPSKDRIHLAAGSTWFRTKSVDNVARTLVHEIGHRAFYRIMSSQGRASWLAFFDAMQAPPDVEGMIRAWSIYVAEAPDEKEKRRRSHFSVWYPVLQERDPEAAAWLLMAVDFLGAEKGEKLDNYHGYPTSTSVPALPILTARKDEVRIFVEPVTAYSATSAGELFAEAFAHYILLGPRALGPMLRDQFQRTLPKMRIASTQRIVSAYLGLRD